MTLYEFWWRAESMLNALWIKRYAVGRVIMTMLTDCFHTTGRLNVHYKKKFRFARKGFWHIRGGAQRHGLGVDHLCETGYAWNAMELLNRNSAFKSPWQMYLKLRWINLYVLRSSPQWQMMAGRTKSRSSRTVSTITEINGIRKVNSFKQLYSIPIYILYWHRDIKFTVLWCIRCTSYVVIIRP